MSLIQEIGATVGSNDAAVGFVREHHLGDLVGRVGAFGEPFPQAGAEPMWPCLKALPLHNGRHRHVADDALARPEQVAVTFVWFGLLDKLPAPPLRAAP